MQNDIKEKLDKFLNTFEHKEDVVGVLVCGSYITGHPNSHSDLDVHLILNDKCTYRERGNRVVDGLLIEYFSNTKRQVLAYFDEDYKDVRTMSQTQFVTGEIYYDATGEVKELKEIAKAQMQKGFSDLNTNPSPLTLYGIWDCVDDLEALMEENRADFDFVYFNRLNFLLSNLYRKLKIPYGLKSVYGHIVSETTRQKYLLEEIKDKNMAELVKIAIVCPDKHKRLDAYKKLSNMVLEEANFDISTFAFKSDEDI